MRAWRQRQWFVPALIRRVLPYEPVGSCSAAFVNSPGEGCQRNLSDEQAELFQAKLPLVLANHVGDRQVLTEAMRVALEGA